MSRMSPEAEKIMAERFGRDSIIALATSENGAPYVRYVNAYYENGRFYSVTHTLSNKMRQIGEYPVVAVAGEWFTAHGKGTSLGAFGKPENRELAGKLKAVFAGWLDKATPHDPCASDAPSRFSSDCLNSTQAC